MAMYYGDENGKAQEVVVVGMQGPAGPQGPQGATGPQGPAGQGVPAGGTAGQVLTKIDGTNYNAEWRTQSEKISLIATGTNFKYYTNHRGIYWAECNNYFTIPVSDIGSSPISGLTTFRGEYEEKIPDGVPTAGTPYLPWTYVPQNTTQIVFMNCGIYYKDNTVPMIRIQVNVHCNPEYPPTPSPAVFKPIVVWFATE